MIVSGAPADKPSRLVSPAEPIMLAGPPPRFVSRGGEKLDAALAGFGIDLRGKRVLDAGASTGGFTDCALQRGAASVVAIDVGYGQLDTRLRDDARVEVRERVNVRTLRPGDVDPPADAVVADLSFISLRSVLDALLSSSRPGAALVLLVKPQFEAGREAASKGRGVIRDPAIRADAVAAVASALEDRGATIMGAMVSPLRGNEGNVEFLLHAVAPGGPPEQGVELDDVRRVALEAAP